MKKLFILLMVTGLLCSLAACNKSSEDDLSNATSQTESMSESSIVDNSSNVDSSETSQPDKNETPEEYLHRKYNVEVVLDEDLDGTLIYKIADTGNRIVLYDIAKISDAPFWDATKADLYDSQYADGGYSVMAYNEIQEFYNNMLKDSCGSFHVFPMIEDVVFPEAISTNKSFADNLKEYKEFITPTLYIASDKDFSEDELNALRSKLLNEGDVDTLKIISMSSNEQASADWNEILTNWDEQTVILNEKLQ